jgi:hypothetical protein
MSFHTKTFVDGHSMFRCILGIFFQIFQFFLMYLKNTFIIRAFAPMSQNTMSLLAIVNSRMKYCRHRDG